MNAVGYALPTTIRIMHHQRLKGSPLFSLWYGRYSLKVGFWKQIRLLYQNGYSRTNKD